MLRLLPGGSAPRIRLLAKFVEKDFEKLDKLVKLRRDYASKVSAIEADIKTERARTNADDLEEMEAEWLSRRMDAGLFSLQVFISPPYCNFLLSDCAECGCQTTDVILAWLIAEDDGANRKIKALLADRDESASMLRVTLQGSHFPLLPPLPIQSHFSSCESDHRKANTIYRATKRAPRGRGGRQNDGRYA
jgi:beta-catenin-like protein 1